jgi:glycosyltransferase involved in cell wall biosynthesis
MKRLSIGIDVHSIGSQSGGNETYYRELLKQLVRCRSQYQFYLYHTHPPAVGQAISSGSCYCLKRLVPGYRWLRIPFTIPWRAHADKLDLFHAQFIVPPFLKCKTVTTIPDIAYEHFPELFPTHQTVLLKILVRAAARRADHIITVSEYSKWDIIRTYGVKPENITVTYEAAGPEFDPIDRGKAKEDVERKYGIREAFVLYVGRLQARKNLARLIGSYARVRRNGFNQKLVLVGKQDSFSQSIGTRIRELGIEKAVVQLGYVNGKDLPTLYSAAEVFIYPSLYEGFGLPVLEAMACGTPVITSRGSSLGEVAGDACLLVEPRDESSITGALQRMLEDRGLREQLSQAGLKRSSQFSFENMARATLGVYGRLLGSGGEKAERGNSVRNLSLERRLCL